MKKRGHQNLINEAKASNEKKIDSFLKRRTEPDRDDDIVQIGEPRTDLKIQNNVKEHFSKLNLFLIEEKFLNSKELLSVISQLCSIVKCNQQIRLDLIKRQDLHILLEILDENMDNESIIIACLEFFNNLVENSEELLIEACRLGLISMFIKYVSEQFTLQIRIEAVYFIGMIISFSKSTREIFVSCGGLSAFEQIFDISQIEETDLIVLGLECLLILLEERVLTQFHILEMVKNYLLEKLLYIIDYYSKSKKTQNSSSLVIKSLDSLLALSTYDNLRIRRRMSEEKIIEVLQIFLNRYEGNELLLRKLIRIFRNISSEPFIQSRLEVKGLIPLLIRMIFMHFKNEKEVNKEILSDLLTTLYLMIKLSPERQEQVAVCGGIPMLISIAERSKDTQISSTSTNILCSLAQYAERRTESYYSIIFEAGVLKFLINSITNNRDVPKALESIYEWFRTQPDVVVDSLIKPQFIVDLIHYIGSKTPSDVSKVIRLISQMLIDSKRLSYHFSKNPGLIEALSNILIDEIFDDNLVMTKKDILEAIYCLSNSTEKAIPNFKIYKTVVQILQSAKDEENVMLEDISTRIIALFSDN